MKYFYIVWIIFFWKLVHSCELKVKIADGVLKGKTLKSRDGRNFYSYTAIPFAKPPIGELRFKAPEPIEPWKGELDATKDAKICVQNKVEESQEDCLYLNVYSPETKKKLLPVMFWIHGGAFDMGNSRSDSFGPDYFMDKDVVLVTTNYRLGILGFLSTEDDAIPGNYGLKDQVLALRWVQKNIIQFNGNPNNVTIFGESAGAASVGYHMLSPMSKGLFHKAILQSGTPTCLWTILSTEIVRKRTYSVATIAGCNFKTSKDILNCLRKLPAKYLLELSNKLYAWAQYPSILFTPVVENCNSGQEAFICRNPIYDFKQESFVPAIIGLNSAEGGYFVSTLYNSTSLKYPELEIYTYRLWSILLFYNQYAKPEDIDEIGKRLIKEYYPSGKMDDHTKLNSVNMMGDITFDDCIFDMTKKLTSPVHSYLYDHQNEFSYNEVYGSNDRSLGVTHGDDLTSLFKQISINPKALNEDDLKVSKLMINIWTKFVTSNVPTIDGTDNGDIWPTLSSTEFPFLYINSSQPKIIQDPLKKKYAFWKKLRPIITGQSSATSENTSEYTEL